MKILLLIMAGLVGVVSTLLAGNSLPYYTIYGMLRDEGGLSFATGEAFVVVRNSAGKEITRAPCDSSDGLGINYVVEIPIDSGISGPYYKVESMRKGETFSVRIDTGAGLLVPSAKGVTSFTVGGSTDTARIDFVLGADRNNDGIPDDWERAYLLAAGKDPNGTLNPDEDFDSDGFTNIQEFVAGTDPTDPRSTLRLEIVNIENGYAELQFEAVSGCTYCISSSMNLKDWAPQRFALKPEATSLADKIIATDYQTLSVFAPVSPSTKTIFFRLHVY